MKHGVPYDVAMSWPQDWALAAYVILGRYEGGDWDWGSLSWKEREAP